jgi:CRP/FNR family cyclic AMP-dependent transcriptional regulator
MSLRVGRSGPWPPGGVMAGLTPAERAALLAAGMEVEFPHDSRLVRQGELADRLFVIIDGYVKVVQTTPEGSSAVLAVRSRGDLIGEYALLDGAPRIADVFAVNTVIAVRIGERRFREFARRHPRAETFIYKGVIDKARKSAMRRTEAQAWDARTRLAKILHELAVDYGVRREAGVEIPPLSQFELGSLAGVSEATTERHLHEFRAKGLVRTRYRKILVLDMDGLAAVWKTG